MGFQHLARRLTEDPTLTRVVGRAADVLAVAEPARAFTLAGLANASERRPILVAVPTTAEADRLATDLSVYLGPDEVMVFPAWETLPFERISPSIEAMGNRLRVLWAIQDPARCPKIILAPVRALIQRLSPHVEEFDPIVVGAEDRIDVDDLVRRLVEFGYRRETQVEHRGELAVRGSIIDVFPSTADGPYRIDLWGDEVDRLCEFTVSDQRSTVDRAEVEIYPCRELLVTDDVRKRADALIGEEPWGREQWQRLADGETFDGMESWLPWLSDDERVLPDLLSSDAMVVLVEPRRMKDRGTDLLAEEADLAASLAKTWGAVPEAAGGDPEDDSADGPVGESPTFPRLHLSFDRLLAHTTVPAVTMSAVPEGPDVAVLTASGWEAPGEQMAARLHQLLGGADPARVVIAADGAGTAARAAELLAEWGVQPVDHGETLPEVFGPGAHLVVTSMERGFVLPDADGGSGIAVLTEADLTGRRRAHRRARARKRQSEGFFDDLRPGHYVVHHHHGVGRFAGMVRRAIGGPERDYLLLEYKGDDKLYLPSDQIDLIRRFTGGDTPTLNKLGGADFAKAKSRVRSAVAEIAQELVVLYQKRTTADGHAYAPDTPWQSEVEAAFPYELTPDQASAIVEVKDDMEQSTADGPPRRRRRRLRQDRDRAAGRVQGRAGRQAGRHPRPDHPAGPAALPDLHRAIRPLPDPGRGAQPVPDHGPGPQGGGRHHRGRGRRADRHPPHPVGRRSLRQARPAGGRRGAAVRRHPQGGAQGVRGGYRHGPVGRGRVDPVGHADPPDPGDEPDRHPRPVGAQHPAGRPPARS